MPYVGPENVPGRGINALDTATNVGGESAGLQAVLAQLRARGATKIDANAIRSLVNENARDPGSADVNPQTLGPTVLNLRNAGIEDANDGNTSAAPSGSVSATPPKFYSDDAATQPLPVGSPPAGDAGVGAGGVPGSGEGGSSLLGLLPGAGGLGAAILTHMMLNRGVPVPPPAAAVIPSPAAVQAGPRLTTTGPGFDPEIGPVGARPSGPGFDPEYGPARPAAPPTQPAPGPRAPVEPVVPPVAPSPATAPVPPTPASAAIDKAVGSDAPAGRAKGLGGRAPRAKTPRMPIPMIR